MADGKNTQSASKIRRSCLMCNDEDDDRMIKCSVCTSLFHQHCVGVPTETDQRLWRCQDCYELAESGVDVSQFAPIDASASTHVAITTNHTCIGPTENASQPIVTHNLKNATHVVATTLGDIQSALAHEHGGATAEVSSVPLQRISSQSMHPTSVAAEAPTARGRYLQQRLQLLEEELRLVQKRQQLLVELEKEGMLENNAEAQVTGNAPGPSRTHNRPPIFGAADSAVRVDNQSHGPMSQFAGFSFLPRADNTVENGTYTTVRLTNEQIASRKGLCKELPKFTGKPEEWPLFKASYDQSTQLCGFSDAENLLRLRQAVEGPARNAVKNLILHASCVPQIISTLQMKFGRPELIIDVLLAQIRDLPPPKESKLESIVDFAIEVQNICATMKASSLTNHLNNPELEQELVCKLPGLLPAFWGMQKLSSSTCNLEDFSNWLFKLAEGANAVIIPSTATKQRKRGSLHTHLDCEHGTAAHCLVCGSTCEAINVCTKFKHLSRSDKWMIVRDYSLCKRCLKPHSFEQSTSKNTCGINNCRCAHHPLLHKIYISKQNKTSTVPQPQPAAVDATCNAHTEETNVAIFRILPVTIYGNGVQIDTYAFFDDGSSLTLMDEELQRALNVEGVPQPLCLKWTGDTHRNEDESVRVNLEISPIGRVKRFDLKNVHTVKKLQLPPQTLDVAKLKAAYKHLRGVPLSSYSRAVPRLLIGIDNSRLGSCLKSKEGFSSDPIAEKTRLGWTLKGTITDRVQSKSRSFQRVFHVCECNATYNEELLKTVKDFILLDNVDVAAAPKVLSDEDQLAVSQLEQYTVRRGDRFETSLLWRGERPSLPDSYPSALRRASCLRRKMSKDPELADSLQEKIKHYVRKGYARKLRQDEKEMDCCWYLPIFAVKNPNKPGKIRLVWDAAAQVKTVSLNSMLLKGPDQLSSLVSILRRFRQKPIAIGGDIAEMFHQVRMRERDQHFQRFLWFEEGATIPDIYILQVMTFGASCSPSCAQFVKNKNAKGFESEYPRAVKSIIDNHYVDDMLDSVDTEAEALQLARDVHRIHSHAGFEIRNWVSNSDAVLQELGATPTTSLKFDGAHGLGVEKVLGMFWHTNEDCFTFAVSQKLRNRDFISGERKPTKREMLSVVMAIFDPLGLIAHYVIYAKIILQEIWRTGCSWDDPIHDEQYTKWLRWVRMLPEVENIQIPRYYSSASGSLNRIVELHTFVDASENSYAAVSYLLFTGGSSNQCAIVGSKTRVSPLKPMSIPRLELQAALIGARLAVGIVKSLTIPIASQTFWTDSRTVLSWLRSDQRRYRQFVAFRISEILELTDVALWRWVPTAENVADDATKWSKSPDLSNHSRWLNGPAFLQENKSSWPFERETNRSTNEELRSQYVGHHFASRSVAQLHIDFSRFSRYSKLRRVIATVISIGNYWISVVKYHKQKPSPISSEDLKRAEILIISIVQQQNFADEVAALKEGKVIKKSSSIFSLTPVMDGAGLIRLGGRVRCAYYGDPIILPKNHCVTYLIVNEYHLRYHHSNSETVVNELRQTYWIPSLRVVVNKVRRACQLCRNRSVHAQAPRMSPLPDARLAAYCRPFSYVGVDYFGPMMVAVRRSREKRYGVLFTCLTIRAVHLELVSSLSTDSCIIAVRNFTARRGVPIEMWSDNGTNFRGAERELKAALKAADQDKIIATFTTAATIWKFIPPSSPHMGGVWERLVRSVKHVLYQILPSCTPSEEVLRAALLEVEMCVNSRPLTYIPVDSDVEEALTPNHFILGNSSGAKPLTQEGNDGVSLRRSWQTAQQIANSFWKRW
ncbi:uncharacterized protein LOC118756395, partial [Rhagoletis pomonella]|uniref:uncharacterized protein LOC118756395 n=1 Tax=Rhagoletis pomonella TaxID=28610 RepID=UPI001780A221